jgi:CheY-like chemotaxis protein
MGAALLGRTTDQSVRTDVRIVLGETNPELRSAFQLALYRRGFRDIEICKDITTLVAMLQTHFVDLMILASDFPGLEFADLVQQMRNQTIGRNPFSLVLATIQDPTLPQLRKVVNAGVDRIVNKPLSMSDMIAAVNGLATMRKPFVASDSYVGPTRRVAARPDQLPEEMIDVPNPLRAKLEDGLTTESLEPLVGATMGHLKEMRTRNCCSAIGRSIRRLASHMQGNGDKAMVTQELSRLLSLSEAAKCRFGGTSLNHIATIANSLGLLVERIAALSSDSTEMRQISLELLQKLGITITRLGLGEPANNATLEEIAHRVRFFVHRIS